MLKKLFMACLAATLLTGCFKDPESICNYDACQFKAPTSEINALKGYLDGAGIQATEHCSGMFYTIEAAGTGATPDVCSQVAVKYKGMLTNGNIFDQQTVNPVAFNLGTLIPAWKNGLGMIKEGGKMMLYVPPTLGYGAQEVKDGNGNVIIPANSILIFEIELVAVR